MLWALADLTAATSGHTHLQLTSGPEQVQPLDDVSGGHRGALSADYCTICNALVAGTAPAAQGAIDFDRGADASLQVADLLGPHAPAFWATTASRAPPSAVL
jgi:hypothetical protein